MDITVKNTDSSPQYFFKSDMALTDSSNNQYDNVYGGTFDGGKLQRGVERSGSVFFKLGTYKPSVVTLNINDGYDHNYNIMTKSMLVTLQK